MSASPPILLNMQDDVATLTLNRPERMNALTPHLFTQAVLAIDEALAGGARALVLTGAGNAFCSGADMMPDAYEDGSRQGRAASMPEDLGAVLERYYNPFVQKIAALDVPLITAINGPAVGAGLGLALLGDISIMARSAYVMLAFVNIGLVPDAGATWLVAQSVGRAKALEMALLGEKMDAQDALSAGLITRVVDDGEVLEQAQAIAQRLAKGPSIAIGMIRKQVAAALTKDLDGNLLMERANQRRAGMTADFHEAALAFAQKRPPHFTGR